MIAPIILDSCEVGALVRVLWLQIYICISTFLNTTNTPMMLDELGGFPHDVIAKIRMLCVWYKFDPFNAHTFSSISYWYKH